MNKQKLTYKEVADFCRQLSLLLNAGITPYESVNLMLQDNTDLKSQEIFKLILAKLEDGEQLSSAIISTGLFPDYMTSMLILGEETGSVDKILDGLSNYYDQQCELRNSINNALLYPVILVFMLFFIIFILFIKVLPTINQVYTQLGSSITGFSAYLLSFSNTLQAASIIIYSIFFVLIVILIIAYYLFMGQNRRPYFIYRLKSLSNLFLNISYSQFASCLALISSSGVDLYEGLLIIKNVIAYPSFKEKIDQATHYLKNDGDYIYEALNKANIFNAINIRMLQIAYKSGSPDAVLNKISKDYENTIYNRIQNIINIFEPTLVIIFSLVVGLVLLSALLPLIGIMATIG